MRLLAHFGIANNGFRFQCCWANKRRGRATCAPRARFERVISISGNGTATKCNGHPYPDTTIPCHFIFTHTHTHTQRQTLYVCAFVTSTVCTRHSKIPMANISVICFRENVRKMVVIHAHAMCASVYFGVFIFPQTRFSYFFVDQKKNRTMHCMGWVAAFELKRFFCFCSFGRSS